MKWLLLNQHYVNLEFLNCRMSVLEEVVSSEQQLVQLLVSGLVSHQTMILHGPGLVCCNQKGLNDPVEYRQ